MERCTRAGMVLEEDCCVTSDLDACICLSLIQMMAAATVVIVRSGPDQTIAYSICKFASKYVRLQAAPFGRP